ncbi:DASH complex subunit Dad1-domain-containing protein [Crepidotus variabilis]|uniref:DASH complex subunit DAD1 n=1 Tax=Crepidotus variabilis TaxID=179855 RepID=A0A9P6ETH5_9AGAR|nr:DASH complex subunit Dad1-domain-containing protein [Crepidotus variabilis]
MSHNEEEPSFFDRERDKLSREITSGFEELLSSTNGLNRKLEEVLGMTKEYDTIASLWHTFYQLMRNSNEEGGDESTMEEQDRGAGMPGTGGHVVSSTKPMTKSDGPSQPKS